MKKLKTYIRLSLLFMLSACSNEPYDTGDGALSDMRADFVEAQTDASADIVSIETDDDERMFLTGAVSVAWAERPDTFYRALLYYNKVGADNGTPRAELLGIKQVLVPAVIAVDDMEGEVKTDPLDFVSSWPSTNGKYLNLEMSVKAGSENGQYNAQTIGLICDKVEGKAGGGRRISLRLYHDQNGVPEYYSVDTYVSIAVSRLPVEPVAGDEVVVEINTYAGTITKTFTF